MGNLFSIENDLLESRSHCDPISNGHIAHITKQYITILKARTILTDIQNGMKKNDYYVNPEIYLIHLDDVLEDLKKGKPSPETLRIFQPVEKVTGLAKDGTLAKELFTVLDQYNNFFLHDYSTLPSNTERINKAKVINKNLEIAANNALEILSGHCLALGETDGTETEGTEGTGSSNSQDLLLPDEIAPGISGNSPIKLLYDQAVSYAGVDPEKTQEIINQLSAISPEIAAELLKRVNMLRG